MTPIRTACTYDCPDACGLVLVDDDGRRRLRGDPDHPITRGFVCQRIRRHLERLGHTERLLRPLRRDGSGWRELGWDEALDLAAEALGRALADHGPESVVFVHGGGSLGLRMELVRHFFWSLGPVTTVGGGACGEAGDAAQRLDFGDAACHDSTDLEHSRAVVLWGKNPVATGVHLVPFLLAARARGAPIVLVEVRPTESTRLADRVVRIAPGGDGHLALAVLRRLHDTGRLDSKAAARADNFDELTTWLGEPDRTVERLSERAGAAVADVGFLADLYSGHRPVATLVGWGLQRRSSGGRNLRCIDALGLLTGQVGVAGGGVSFTSTRRRGLDFSWRAPRTGRQIPAHALGTSLAALDDPPARFVYVAGANPVTQLPDSRATAAALRRAGFTVVADAFFTDTAEAADLVLPVTLMLEEDDVVGSYQHHHVAPARRAVAPPDGPRSDLRILDELRRRIGMPPDEVLADPARTLAVMTAPWFGEVEPRATRNPAHDVVPFAERFPTASGKARLITEVPGLVPERAGYPLVLLTPSCRAWQTSQRFEADQIGLPTCSVHAETAAAAGLADDSDAVLESPIGSLAVTLRFDAGLDRGCCVVRRGGWVRHGHGANVLVEARETDLGGGTAFYDQRVRLVARAARVDTPPTDR